MLLAHSPLAALRSHGWSHGAAMAGFRSMAALPYSIRELKPEHLSADHMAHIFLEASGRTFSSEPERIAFRERWLGRYLQGDPDVLLVAQAGGGTVVGYLVGSLEDPATQSRFADISYFRGDFRDLCRAYPAHLHINLAPAFRGKGLGPRLIEAFAERALAAGAPGMHVVTGGQARNLNFYARCGFAPLSTAAWHGREVAFLGRRLDPSP
jgi:GNAT superfamily N-acetyltransferase